MDVRQQICKFIEKEGLAETEDRLLCAVSGGMDSMVMLEALRTSGYYLEVAHINYMLRQPDCLTEEELVITYCQKHHIPCHIKRLSDTEQKDLKQSNLQEKARSIRYHFFHKLLIDNNLDKICTAHHEADNAETFLLHALRSAGMKGLSGIPPKNDMIIRPMLCCSKADIKAFAERHQTPFLTDKSNLESAYDRNYLRNEVMPVLQRRWAATNQRLAKSARHLDEDHKLLQYLVLQKATAYTHKSPDGIKYAPLSSIQAEPMGVQLMYHALAIYGMSRSDIEQIFSKESSSGARFDTTDYFIAIDRDELHIKPKTQSRVELSLPKAGNYTTTLGEIHICQVDLPQPSVDSYVEMIDGDQVVWPLTLRNWRKGDRMQPLGMDGKTQLISDILINKKVSVLDKSTQLVIVDATDTILWLVGIRLSEAVKLTSSTKNYVRLTYSKTQS